MESGLTVIQKFLILGTLLGDGSLEKRWANSRLRVDHYSVSKDFVFWKYNILKNIASNEPKIIRELDKRSGKTCERWAFATRALPGLNFYYDFFYKDGQKIIPKEIVKHFKHPLSLAVWLMDDGYKRNDCNAIRFSTDLFSFEENKILQKCLLRNFKINSKLHKKGKVWNIYIPQPEMRKFNAIVSPYVFQVKSMMYKLPHP
ncbi:MAG: LAGLIDADG endonuclease [Minisyncoccia bacterium]